MDTEYLKKVGLYTLSVILSLAMIFYLGYHLWHSLTREVETTPVTEVTAEKTLSCEGYIFRNETLLPANGGGSSILPAVKSGEKITRGAEVARMYSASSSETVAAITELDDKIELLESCNSGDSVSLKESSKIDKEVDSTLGKIREASSKGDLETVNALRPSLVKLLAKRNLLSGSSHDFASEIKKLEAEKENLISSLGGFNFTVTSPVSGFYYPETDGYETVFVASELSDMTYEKAVDAMASSPVSAPSAGKTVTSSDWYLVIKTDKKYAETFKEGKDYTVRFSAELDLDMEAFRIIPGDDGTVLIFSTKYIPSGFSFTRTQKVEIVYDFCKGYKIPLGAVRVLDSVIGVYVLDEVTIRFRTLETLYKTDTYYIVAPGETVYPDGKPEEKEETEKQNASGKDDPDEDKPEVKVYLPLEFHDNLIIEGKGLYHGRVIG